MNSRTDRPATDGVSVHIPDELITALRARSVCYLATTMPDGSPQLTQTWVDTDGEHVLVNTVTTHQKTGNAQRDSRVSLAVTDPSNPVFYSEI